MMPLFLMPECSSCNGMAGPLSILQVSNMKVFFLQFISGMNKPAINIVEKVSWWSGGAYFGYMPKSDIAGF